MIVVAIAVVISRVACCLNLGVASVRLSYQQPVPYIVASADSIIRNISKQQASPALRKLCAAVYSSMHI